MMLNSIYISFRFYYSLALIILLFVLAMIWPVLFNLTLISLAILTVLFIIDYLYLKKSADLFEGGRVVQEKMSMGDIQNIYYYLYNKNKKKIKVELYDDLPYQFQYRKFIGTFTIEADTELNYKHTIRPSERGIYEFGNLTAFISSSMLGFMQYKKVIFRENLTKVYPSIIQMKKFALQIFSQTARMLGIRRIRTIGENDEFEHIKNYSHGDNVKSINWKATSRKGELLVNQFQDTRSQNVYCIIDKGRSMAMPFEGMTLLDYAINSALVISNIVLRKYDNAGLITFSNDLDRIVPADSQPKQLNAILETLYAQETQFKETNFPLLYYTLRQRVNKRSILLLYTNFEDINDLNRNIYYLKMIQKRHLLVVIAFINSELETYSKKKAINVLDIYTNTLASSIIYEKEKIMKELKNEGIQVVLTTPKNLSVSVINKYLEIKAKRLK